MAGEKKGNISEADALERFPDADPEQACIGVKITDSAAEKWNSRRLSRIFQSEAETDKEKVEVVRRSLEELTEEERWKLPNGAKIFLSDRMPYTREADDMRRKLYESSSDYDWGQLAWQQERQAKMYREMDKDPLIQDAQKRWADPNFSDEDKMRVAERIQKIQADAFGVKTVPMTLDPTLDDHGTYDRDSNIITIGGAEGTSFKGKDFSEFVDTVTHETTHSTQDQIVERYKQLKGIEDQTLKDLGEQSVTKLSPEGKAVYQSEYDRRVREAFPNGDPSGLNKELGPDGRLRHAAELFLHSQETYMSSKTSGADNYLANPTEAHAWEFGNGAGSFIRENPEQRAKTISKLEDETKTYNEFSEGDIKRRHETRAAPQMCPA